MYCIENNVKQQNDIEVNVNRGFKLNCNLKERHLKENNALQWTQCPNPHNHS